MNFLKLASSLGNNKDVISFVKSHNLIKSQRRCSICKSRMNFQADSTTMDEFRWRCKNSRCRKTRSIRANSFFDNSHLSIKQIIFIIYLWSKGYSLKLATDELKITKKTMIDWYRFCRDMVVFHYQNEDPDSSKIGGVGEIVEIDESVFSKRKYYRGRVVKETWVFGGVNRDKTKKVIFAEIVPDRSQETLLEVKILNLTLTKTLTLNLT